MHGLILSDLTRGRNAQHNKSLRDSSAFEKLWCRLLARTGQEETVRQGRIRLGARRLGERFYLPVDTMCNIVAGEVRRLYV